MKINLMREYIRLTETKNYTKTAEELFITQSALSRHIASLEEEVGTPLINRSRNSFELTVAGEIALEQFKTIVKEYQTMLEKISRLSDEEGRELHVGVLYYDYQSYVRRIRESFLSHFPGVRLVLHSCQPEQLEQNLLNGVVDVAILYAFSDVREDLQSYDFLKIPITVMFAPDHRLGTLEEITAADLNGETVLLPERQLELNQYGRIFTRLLEESDVSYEGTNVISNYDEVPFLVNDTGAIYVVPMANPGIYQGQIEYRYLDQEGATVPVSAVWRADNDNPAIRQLLSAIKISYP